VLAVACADSGELTEKLRTQATIIDDFFGRAWVEKICAPEDVVALPTARRVSETQKNFLESFFEIWAWPITSGRGAYRRRDERAKKLTRG